MGGSREDDGFTVLGPGGETPQTRRPVVRKESGTDGRNR